jgi:hypothetical protein
MYYASRIAGALAVAALLAATWISIRLARADALFRAHDPASVARAIALVPGNTEYLLFRALQVDYDGGDPAQLLERAAELNPLSSTPRIRLGLLAELRGNFGSAETELLGAARIDRQFEPRWTLANFYFRRGNAPEFWKWMRAALEVSYGDRRPAFDLCWRISGDATEILSRAIPDRHEVIGAYLTYLLQTHRATEVASVAMKFAETHQPGDIALLLAACDALIDARDAPAAVALWRAMGYPLPVTFETPRVGAGFDWRMTESPGVMHIFVDQPQQTHRIMLSGRQPESCVLMRRIENLRPGERYTLRWEARTQNLGEPSGITWRIGREHAAVASNAGEIAFTATSELAPITLFYERPSGQPRAEGSVELWHVTIAPR